MPPKVPWLTASVESVTLLLETPSRMSATSSRRQSFPHEAQVGKQHDAFSKAYMPLDLLADRLYICLSNSFTQYLCFLVSADSKDRSKRLPCSVLPSGQIHSAALIKINWLFLRHCDFSPTSNFRLKKPDPLESALAILCRLLGDSPKPGISRARVLLVETTSKYGCGQGSILWAWWSRYGGPSSPLKRKLRSVTPTLNYGALRKLQYRKVHPTPGSHYTHHQKRHVHHRPRRPRQHGEELL